MNTNLSTLIEYPKQGIISKEIKTQNNENASLFCMAAKTEIGNHASTKTGLIYIIEGDGIFNLEGKNIKMKPGGLIIVKDIIISPFRCLLLDSKGATAWGNKRVLCYSMKKNAAHSLKASKNTSFLLILS